GVIPQFKVNYRAVLPKALQGVENTVLGVLDMDDDVRVVQEHPAAFGTAFPTNRAKVLLHQFFLDAINDCVDLAFWGRRGNEEDVSQGEAFTDIEGNDVFCQFVGRSTRGVTGEGDGLFMCRHGTPCCGRWPVNGVSRVLAKLTAGDHDDADD